MRIYWKVLGIDRANEEVYCLTFTADKKKAEQYYRAFGWNKKDLLFIPMYGRKFGDVLI